MEQIFQIENNILTAYSGSDSVVAIPDGVVRIDTKAFYSNRSVTKIVLPDSLQTIGEAAFTNCIALESISWGNGLTVIENHAFAGCRSLTCLELPQGLKRIELSAFSPCSALKTLILPESLEYIGEFAFSCCGALSRISFPDSLQVIDRSAFSMCRRLCEVTLPAALKAILRGTFLGCGMLKELNIKANVSSVENNAFSGCRNLLRINVDPANPFLKSEDGILYSRDGRCLKYFPGGRLEIVIPESVTEIGDEAFYENQNFDRIALPSSLSRIGASAFYGCTELTQIALPSSVRELGQSAFERCSGISCISIPDRIQAIGSSAFRGCKKLMWIRLPEGFSFDLHWFSAPNDPPCYSADHTVIPFVSTRELTDITSDIGTHRAALGMIMAENAGVRPETYLSAAYIDYIRAHVTDYYDDMLSDEDILNWLLDHRLIPEQDTERLLEKASSMGRAGASALLLDYKSSQQLSSARVQTPKTTLDDHFSALENALDF